MVLDICTDSTYIINMNQLNLI